MCPKSLSIGLYLLVYTSQKPIHLKSHLHCVKYLNILEWHKQTLVALLISTRSLKKEKKNLCAFCSFFRNKNKCKTDYS